MRPYSAGSGPLREVVIASGVSFVYWTLTAVWQRAIEGSGHRESEGRHRSYRTKRCWQRPSKKVVIARAARGSSHREQCPRCRTTIRLMPSQQLIERSGHREAAQRALPGHREEQAHAAVHRRKWSSRAHEENLGAHQRTRSQQFAEEDGHRDKLDRLARSLRHLPRSSPSKEAVIANAGIEVRDAIPTPAAAHLFPLLLPSGQPKMSRKAAKGKEVPSLTSVQGIWGY